MHTFAQEKWLQKSALTKLIGIFSPKKKKKRSLLNWPETWDIDLEQSYM